MTPEGIEAFIRLFHGRVDCYGDWDGGCIKQPLTKRQFEQHLTTGPYIGVYPNVGGHAAWGCVDIDFDDLQLATNIVTVLGVKGVKGWVEKTRRGYHVWVFPDVAVIPAADMRRCLMAACKAIGYDPKEVNPKQEHLPPEKVGNYVRLPYPGGNEATERRFVSPLGQPMVGAATYRSGPATYENWILYLDEHGRSPAAAIADTAKLWTPPVTQRELALDVDAGLEVENILPMLDGLAFTMWRDGPLEGSDRSSTLAHLSHLLVEQLRPSAALAVLLSADLRWGKFHDKGDTRPLVDMIERAVAKREGE
jgi:hypothetical protein